MSHFTPIDQRAITAVRKRGQLIIPNHFPFQGLEAIVTTHTLTPAIISGLSAGYVQGKGGILTPDNISGVGIFQFASSGPTTCIFSFVGQVPGSPEVALSISIDNEPTLLDAPFTLDGAQYVNSGEGRAWESILGANVGVGLPVTIKVTDP